MRGVNKVFILGNLGSDPDVKYDQQGNVSFATISVATSSSWNDKQTGEPRVETEWHTVTFYQGLAGVTAKYLKKGMSVFVEGSIHYRKYTDKNGIERWATNVKAESMQMLGGANQQAPVMQQAPVIQQAPTVSDENPFLPQGQGFIPNVTFP